MKPLVSEKRARLTYLKRQLVKSCPVRVKKLIKEIDELQKEIGGDGEVLRRQSKNYIPRRLPAHERTQTRSLPVFSKERN